MLQTKRNLLCVALASAMTLGTHAAHAQSTEQNAEQAKDGDATTKDKGKQTTDLDKVTVTGIRGAINRSVDAKQESTSIVETVSAEDIGKLPDASIADSLARLPGLTAQRDRGRAADINIRGFAGDFAATTLNGREQASTGDNRGVEFDQYPSEVLSGVTVYKTPDAHLVGQGLSGTVDMQTVRPLSFDKRVVSFNARYDENRIDDLKEHGNRYSASYIDQFFDHKLGVAIGFAHEDSPQPNYQNEAYGYTGMPGATDGTSVIGGGKVYMLDDRNKRDGVMATVQFQPNDVWESTLDVFHSHFKRPEIKTGLEFGTVWGPGGQVLESDTVEGATATSSSWSNVHPVIRMDSDPIDDTLDSIGWNNKFHFDGNWTLNTDFSLSNVKRKMRFLETYAGVATAAAGTTVDIGLDPGGDFNNYTFGTDFGDPANLVLTDAAGWGQDGYLKNFLVKDKVKQGRINLVHDIDEGAVSSIDFGINVTKRTKTKTSNESKLCLVTCSDGMNGDTAAFPGSSIVDFGGFGGIGSIASYNAEDALDSGIWNLDTKYDPNIAAKNWSVDEKLTTLYFQANIDTTLWGMPLRGNAGVQQIYTDQNSEGYGTYSGDPAGELVSDGATYAEFLPSLNLGLEFMPDTVLRFAAGKQMARPRMDQMKAGMDVSICTGCAQITLADGSKSTGTYWSGNGGNPKLKPWMADAYDLSLEHYFSTAAGNRGYFGAAFFYKDLTTYIYQQNELHDFSGEPLPAPIDGQADYPAGTEGMISQPANGKGGSIHGYELTASLPLDLLWAPLDGFGLIATYSDTKSAIKPFGPDSTQPLPGLSKYVSNITAYWERNGFSIRYNYRQRSAFLGETRAYGADLQYINFAADTVQDAQVNYTFPDGSKFKGLSLYLQVSNIGDEPSKTYDAGDPAHRPIAYYKYGRTTLAGLGYKF